jgi:hypothetical protein
MMFVLEKHCVPFDVGTVFLNIIYMIFVLSYCLASVIIKA